MAFANTSRSRLEMLRELGTHVGEEVEVISVDKERRLKATKGMLTDVGVFSHVRVGDEDIPLLGREVAVSAIWYGGARVYHNPHVNREYSVEDPEKLEQLVLKTFGLEGLAARSVGHVLITTSEFNAARAELVGLMLSRKRVTDSSAGALAEVFGVDLRE